MAMAPILMVLFFLAASSSSPVNFVVSQDIPSCAQSLIPCASYMKDASPPSSCCDVLKKTIENNFSCLCKLYEAPTFFSSMSINKTDAITLPTRCKISGGSCDAVAPTSQSQPGTPRNTAGYSIGAVSWTATCTLLLFWVSSLMF